MYIQVLECHRQNSFYFMFLLEKCDERRGLVSKVVILIYPSVQIIIYVPLWKKLNVKKGRVIMILYPVKKRWTNKLRYNNQIKCDDILYMMCTSSELWITSRKRLLSNFYNLLYYRQRIKFTSFILNAYYLTWCCLIYHLYTLFIILWKAVAVIYNA